MKLKHKKSQITLLAVGYSLSAIFQKLLGFILFLWLARNLSVSEYGLFNLLYALQAGVMVFSSAGIIEMTIGQRHLSSSTSRGDSWAVANGYFLWLSLIAAIISLPIYKVWISNESLAVWFWVILGGVLNAFFQLQSALVRLDEQHIRSIFLLNLPIAVGFVAAFIGILITHQLEPMFMLMSLAIGLTCVWLMFTRRLPLMVQLNGFSSSSVVSKIFPFLIVGILTWSTGYGGMYLVSSMRSLEDVGVFAFVYTLSSLLQLLATSLNQVWTPIFFNWSNQHPPLDFEVHNAKFYLAQGLVISIASGLIIAFYDPILTLLGGTLIQYQKGGSGLAWILASYIVSIPWWHAQNYFYIYQKGTDLMIVVGLSTTLGLLLWLISMSLFGVKGIYIGFFLMMLLRSIFIWIWARRIWNIPFHMKAVATGLIIIGGTSWIIGA